MAGNNPSKAVRFAQLLAEANGKKQGAKVTREELGKQLTKVKKMASLPGVRRTFRQELEHLENLVLQIANLEKELLQKEDLDIKDLKKEIVGLKSQLSLVQTGELKQKLDRINFLIAELGSRINTYVNIKTDREKRMEELEKKIKEKMEVNFQEITKLEKQVSSLEEKYESLKSSGKHSEEHLKTISDRLFELKEKLIVKKIAVVEKKKSELEERPMPRRPMQFAPKPIPPPKMIFPKEEPVKHKMIFPNHVPSPPKELRELPKPPMMLPKPREDFNFSKEMPPPKPEKKKGLVAWLKRLVG